MKEFMLVMKTLIIATVLFWSMLFFSLWLLDLDEAQGAELRLLEPTKLTMEHYSVVNNRDEYLRINDAGATKYDPESGEHWTYGSAVKFDFDLVRYGSSSLYWANNVHMSATNVAVRHVGWEFELGARATKHLDFFYYHHSEHLLDESREDRRFPLVNRYGFRFVLIEKGRK